MPTTSNTSRFMKMGVHSQMSVHTQFSLRYLVGGGSVDEGLSSTENLKGFIEIIIPLLIECWIEAVPPQLSASVGNGVEREPLQVMQQVLNVISVLWKLSKQHGETHKLESWLRKNYLSDFEHHFMSHFPYALKEITEHRRKETNKSTKHCTIVSNNIDHLLLNLTLSDIIFSLASASTLAKDSSWIETIRKFVTETLEDGFRLNSKQLNRLLGVSWRLMQIQPNRGCHATCVHHCLGCIWSRRDKKENKHLAPTIRATISQFHTLTKCVVSTIRGWAKNSKLGREPESSRSGLTLLMV
ncbi:testis-expressed protein 10-like [Cynocephalus volans]|uniref:testis-expressed protein 10-like n=1 Tax=Cynocephalus volans TaxID=110931 RepID=UPI002FCC31FD